MANSPSLNISLLSENQAAKEATINAALLRLEAVGQQSLSVDATAGNVTLTAVQAAKYARYAVSGNVSTVTISIPQVHTDLTPVERIVIVDNKSASTINFNGVVGGTVSIAAGTASLIYVNSTTLSVLNLSATGIATSSLMSIKETSGTTYTIISSDLSKVINRTNASAMTVTVPLEATTSLPVGFNVTFIRDGAGSLSIIPEGGVTLKSAGSVVTARVQYSALTLIKTDTNEWFITGDLG